MPPTQPISTHPHGGEENPPRFRIGKEALRVIGWIAIAQCAGLIGLLFTMEALPVWYQALPKPTWSPPEWVFGPVWTILYSLIGIGGYLLWHSPQSRPRSKALRLFWLQLVVNALWTPAFFGLKSPLLGLVILIALWVLIVALVRESARVHVRIALLFTPYLLWTLFALILNASIAYLWWQGIAGM